MIVARGHEVLISIHVPLAGDDGVGAVGAGAGGISIHVPLAGDDAVVVLLAVADGLFLSTSPLRGTTGRSSSHPFYIKFLSTSPLRGTTGQDLPGWHLFRYFYPRPPCGGRRADDLDYAARQLFLSTSPLRGTTP